MAAEVGPLLPALEEVHLASKLATNCGNQDNFLSFLNVELSAAEHALADSQQIVSTQRARLMYLLQNWETMSGTDMLIQEAEQCLNDTAYLDHDSEPLSEPDAVDRNGHAHPPVMQGTVSDRSRLHPFAVVPDYEEPACSERSVVHPSPTQLEVPLVLPFSRRTYRSPTGGIESRSVGIEGCIESPKVSLQNDRFEIAKLTSHRSSDSVQTTESKEDRTFQNMSSERSSDASISKFKDKIKRSITKEEIVQSDLYKDRGWCQHVARSALFEYCTLSVIAFNVMWIAYETNENDESVLVDADLQFQIIEQVFCVFFVSEWLIKIFAFRRKRDGFRDRWFIFDTFLVAMMMLETWILTVFFLLFSHGNDSAKIGNASVLRIARLMRLSRMARMARLLRVFPEVLILVKGIFASMRSVLTTLLLLVVVLYVFGIAFAQLVSGTASEAEKKFPNVQASMYTLLLYGVLSLDFVDDYVQMLVEVHPTLAGLFFVFIFLAAFTVMNMLIGVLCEIVSAVASIEKEDILVSDVKGKIEDVLFATDQDGDKRISRDEFKGLLENETACVALQDVGVDVIHLIDFEDVIFEVSDTLTFEQFMSVVLQLRGSNNATVRDIIELRRLMRSSIMYMQSLLADVGGVKHSLSKLPKVLPAKLRFEPVLSNTKSKTNERLKVKARHNLPAGSRLKG